MFILEIEQSQFGSHEVGDAAEEAEVLTGISGRGSQCWSVIAPIRPLRDRKGTETNVYPASRDHWSPSSECRALPRIFRSGNGRAEERAAANPWLGGIRNGSQDAHPGHQFCTLPNLGRALVALHQGDGSFDHHCQGFIHGVAIGEVPGNSIKQIQSD